MRPFGMCLPFVCALVVFGGGCGGGEDTISFTGVCDGYVVPADSKYVLPFASGQSHSVGQGNCRPISHYGSSKYAYDLSMDVGTKILAARAGTVLEIKEDLADGSGCPDANHVYVKHSDGSVAIYLHLTQNGALVDAGAVVTQGQEIGLSGNSGCSTSPHLHFAVFENDSYLTSLPVTFRNAGDNERGLKTGQTYSASVFTPDAN